MTTSDGLNREHDRYDLLMEKHVIEVCHDATDAWVNLEVAAVLMYGSGLVLLGEHSLTASEARMLAASLTILANVAEPLPEKVQA